MTEKKKVSARPGQKGRKQRVGMGELKKKSRGGPKSRKEAHAAVRHGGRAGVKTRKRHQPRGPTEGELGRPTRKSSR